jgi:hypothetical protein
VTAKETGDDAGSLVVRERLEPSNLAVAQGWPDAKARLDEGLQRSLTTHSRPLVSLSLVGFARLVLAEREAVLMAEAREALGTDRLERAFAAGSRLKRWPRLRTDVAPSPRPVSRSRAPVAGKRA